MDISFHLGFDEGAAVELLNWLARWNAKEIALYDQAAVREARNAVAQGIQPWRRPIPGLYESGVWYEREQGEIWSDAINTMVDGHEDCDALAAWRAGELLARGWQAIRPPWQVLQQWGYPLPADAAVRYPGDEGWEEALRMKPRTIHAEVYVKTNAPVQRPGMYHCVVRYQLSPGGRWYYDDPSARLGMLDGQSAEVQQGLAGSGDGSRKITLDRGPYQGYGQSDTPGAHRPPMARVRRPPPGAMRSLGRMRPARWTAAPGMDGAILKDRTPAGAT